MKTFKSNKETAFVVALLLVFAFMLTLNTMTPMFADDYVYSLNLLLEEPLTGIRDIFHSISNFRNMHNGRIAAHFFAQVFLWLPKTVFNVVNAAMFTLLIYSVCRYISIGEKKSAAMALGAFAMIWLLMPGFGHSVLWLTGSCSYLWAITFIVLFIHPFFVRYYTEGERETTFNPFLEIPAILYAFFVGAYSENGALSALAIVFCFLLLIYIREHKIPLRLILRFVAACAGFLYLMLAPTELGNKNTDSYGVLFPVLAKFGISGGVLVGAVVAALVVAAVMLWGIWRHRRKATGALALIVFAASVLLTALFATMDAMKVDGLLSKVNAIASDTKISLILLGGIYFVLLMLALREGCEMKKLLSAVVLGVGAAISVAVFLIASYFPARGACVATIYITIADAMLFCELRPKIAEMWPKVVATVLTVLFMLTAAAAMPDIRTVEKQFNERMEIVAQAQEQGIEKLTLQPLTAEGKYCAAWQGEAADYYPAMEFLFGIDSITIEGAIGFIYMD